MVIPVLESRHGTVHGDPGLALSLMNNILEDFLRILHPMEHRAEVWHLALDGLATCDEIINASNLVRLQGLSLLQEAGAQQALRNHFFAVGNVVTIIAHHGNGLFNLLLKGIASHSLT